METSGGHISSTTASWGLPGMFLGSPGFPLQKRFLGLFWARGPLGPILSLLGPNLAQNTPKSRISRIFRDLDREWDRDSDRDPNPHVGWWRLVAVGVGWVVQVQWGGAGTGLNQPPPPRGRSLQCKRGG